MISPRQPSSSGMILCLSIFYDFFDCFYKQIVDRSCEIKSTLLISSAKVISFLVESGLRTVFVIYIEKSTLNQQGNEEAESMGDEGQILLFAVSFKYKEIIH